uniref:Uncharacterized protein n=1 Tax=viral metagenome TaxID=1070528 RepID=A0A6C0HZL4_9ZZZZ
MSDCNCDDCYEKNRRLKYKHCNCSDCYEKNRRKNRGCSCRKCEKRDNNCYEKKYFYCYEKPIEYCNSNTCNSNYNRYEKCIKKITDKNENEKCENENIIIININPLQK